MTEKHCKFIYLHWLWISVLMFCVLQIYPVDKVGAQHYSWEEFVEDYLKGYEERSGDSSKERREIYENLKASQWNPYEVDWNLKLKKSW